MAGGGFFFHGVAAAEYHVLDSSTPKSLQKLPGQGSFEVGSACSEIGSVNGCGLNWGCSLTRI